jgi:hypothetical protein
VVNIADNNTGTMYFVENDAAVGSDANQGWPIGQGKPVSAMGRTVQHVNVVRVPNLGKQKALGYVTLE